MPTISQWKTSLYKTKRQILNQDGGTTTNAGTIGVFDYSAYAARLLTYQELKLGCPNSSTAVGSLDNCKYLMENTYYQNTGNSYGYWLETPRASYSSHVWLVYGDNRYVITNDASYSSYYGVRPAIEVLKTDMDY